MPYLEYHELVRELDMLVMQGENLGLDVANFRGALVRCKNSRFYRPPPKGSPYDPGPERLELVGARLVLGHRIERATRLGKQG